MITINVGDNLALVLIAWSVAAMVWAIRKGK